MQPNLFASEAMLPGNPKYEDAVRRSEKLYRKEDDIRSDFSRDYNRILHCKAFRRLKHKTQVFFATTNDHICTRIEHVNHVASVSRSIAGYLGLNTELTDAIALGHDLGHAPFGHDGEHVLNDLLRKETGSDFWHERNSLNFVDNLETLPNLEGKETNLTLTYAVRDGIISHCGEVNENAIFPRDEAIDLCDILHPNQYAPYTWEACVVKIADKISYLGRDIEDALSLGILSKEQIQELSDIAGKIKKVEVNQINNTVLMHDFINNLCAMSNPADGILFSEQFLKLINEVKAFNYKNIYLNPRLDYTIGFTTLVLTSVFDVLVKSHLQGDLFRKCLGEIERIYPSLGGSFAYWMMKYTNMDTEARRNTKFGNRIVYDINNRNDYIRCVVDYISSMTDHFALKIFGELTRF
jgi:dGTPase